MTSATAHASARSTACSPASCTVVSPARDRLFQRCPRRIRRALGWHHQGGHHGVAHHLLALVAGALLSPLPAAANPSGAEVVAGQVRLVASLPATLDIRQSSDKAIINWQSFNIAAGERVNFLQPSAASVTLNRVRGHQPSAIFGRLTANGTVMLVNPNGIVFGAGSVVDVGSLVATTANIRDDDFLAGRWRFSAADGQPQARISNAGEITIKDSGLAALVAPSVQNSGLIQARLGRVMLGAASAFTLDFQGDGLLGFGVGSALLQRPLDENGQPVQALVGNTGTLSADGGTVLISASAVKGVIDQVINTSGVVQARSVSGQGGRIVLSGGDSGAVVMGGSLLASGSAAGDAGGTLVATGDQLRVQRGALLDASGAAGGGRIALGSKVYDTADNAIGERPAGSLSRNTTVAAGARLHADALVQGDGGMITLWSADTTAFAGSLSARGGAQGGQGGFAEVSSLKNIALNGSVDLRAPRGATGTLRIDPTDLRITDVASGASQDGNATDTSVAAADADQGSGASLNTVSRGLLESLSGNADISLQATGLITIDAMAGGLINLATTAGHGFSLQSTLSGGIQFADANTEIRTQGGNITLQAQGLGSALVNIGKLSSNGGAISLSATGDIQLAGAVNAGSGALQASSTVGAISAAGSALLSAASVSLSAPGGHVGSAGQAINTHTAHLALETGGHAVASSDTALASLSLAAGHVAPTAANDYQLSAPGLTFNVSDGAALAVNQISQAAGLNLSLTADRSLQLGTLNVGSGTLTLGSTGGNLLGAADTALSAASLILSANGSNGNNGAIGSSGQALLSATGHLSATAGSGGVYLANTGALALDWLSSTGSSNVSSSGNLTAGDVSVGSATLALGSSGGNVLDDGNAATRISAGTLALTAGGAIGSSGTRLATNASTLSANAASGGVYFGTSATSSVLSSIVSGDGAIDIRTGGSSTLTALSSTTSSAANDITVTATGTGSFSVGTVNAGALGDVSLATSSGSISGNSGLITGNTVTLNAANSGSVSVRTAASHLDVQAGSSSISITQTGAVTLDRIATPSSLASVTSSSGDITVGSVSTSTSGQVSLIAAAGAILDDGNNATRISTGTAALNASASIGSASHALQTQASGLTATSTGDLYVSNTDATLTSLSITNRHATPGVANILQVSSPYLTFDVTDSGTQFALNRVVGVPLSTLAFSGDQTLQIGQVQGAGSVSLSATQGHLVDDGNLNSRVTAGSTLTLSAALGSVGSSGNPIGVNASSLALTTRGDLYVSDLSDLSTLTLTSNHADTSTSHGMAITAPSLKFSVTDSATGHAVHTLTDNSSLALTFTSDRDITLGQVDVTHTGTARFTSSAGSILDDGDKRSRVLANSTTLAGRAVGASGNGHLDVVTGTLAATASAGGVYVELPMPTGSTNTTSTITLGTVTATGPVVISALEGDLSLGGFMTATNQPVSLTANQGGIFSPSGYSIAIGTGSLALDAATAIGSSSRALPVTASAGAALTAQAGTAMFVSASGPLALASLQATTGISYTQSSGALTVGHVDASAGGSVLLTASSGAIQDDGNAATGIRAHQVSLSAAQGSIGSGTAIAVDAPQLLLTARGDIGVADSATLDTLAITRGSSSAGSMAITAAGGQTFNLSEDGSAHYLQSVASATPLAFSFSGPRDLKIGRIEVGSTGSVSLVSATSLVNDGQVGAGIAAGTVSLTAGSTGSIGAAGSGNAIGLEGAGVLNLSAGRHVYVSSDAALSDLNITSTNTTTAAGSASEFGISGLGQIFGIIDSGPTQSLDFIGTTLSNTSFSTRKNIAAGAITATGDVSLSTSGGGANSNISSNSGSGTIAGNRVLLTATSSTAGGGSIGSSGSALRVDTPTVILNGSANVYVNDAQNLARLDMTLTHGTNTTFGYGVTAGNLNSFTVTDGSTQSLGLAVSGAMDFSYSVDRALSLATMDAGTSTTGSISLTSRSAPTGTGAQINRSSGSLTGGTVTLSAAGFNGGVGAGATLSTNSKNLSITTGGNVSVSNSTTLTSLALDARHNTSGSSTHSYSVSSTGLTFSISDTLGNNAFQLSNITQTSLDLSVKADRVITASSVNTGVGGKVTLQSGSYVQGGSGASAGSPSITTGDLTLNGGSAFGYQGSTPLYTAAGTLSSSLSNTLYLSNAGALTLNTNTVGSSADVASSNNSLLQGVDGLFSTPTLKLSANQSLGSNNTLLTDVRRLTLVARNHIDVSNASDLYALTMTSTHATAGVQNTVSVAAPRLALNLSDSVGGNQYHLSNLVDSTGLDFTLSTDVALSLGTVNAQAGRALALYSTGSSTSISNDGGSLLSAGSITLSAGGSLGAAGGSGTRLQTDALALSLATGANAYADNVQDLTSLSLTSSQAAGGTAPVYLVTAPALSFDLSDDGSTHLNQVADSTGLNFVLNTRRDQAVDVIDVGRSGTVSLTSTGDILGDADSSHRISAASATFYASNGGAIGSVGNPIHVSAPLLSLSPTGAMNIESDTHIDRLAISVTHPTVAYGGAYSIVSVPLTGPAYPLFTATDSVTGTALTSLDDPLGLAFSFTSDSAMQLGTLNLGSTGTVALTGTGSGGILGDGDANTLVQAASLSMVSYGGAVGASGSGNGIDATVNAVSATAQGGGVYLALHGRTALGTISATGGINLTNDEGDIALGAINAGGNAVAINNPGGSILSGSISNATTVALTASGSIGNTSAIGTSANGGGTTTLTASASAAHGAAGSIAISESYNLFASSVTAPAAVTLSSGYGLLAGTITSGGAVALSSSQGSISGSSGSNAITGSSVSLSARYGSGNGIGSSGTRLNLNTPQLAINTPGSVYITDSADLSLLTIDRSNYTGTGSSGTLSVIASGLTFSASDSADTTTLTSLADGTGLDFSYLGIGSLAVGSLNVGAGSMLLQAYLSGGDGHIDAINNSALITAGSLTLQAYGTASHIGSSGAPLRLAVGALTASSGSGGMGLQQAGALTLSSLATSGDLAVTASSGDLTLGTLSYGSAKTLSLTASGGSILAGGGTLAGSGSGAAITLSAAHGIGTAAAPIWVNASAGHTLSANVTGSGSLYLSSLGTLNGGLSTAVHDGATTVTAAGAIKLTDIRSGTDAAGNDIHVTASAGDITAISVSGGSGALFNAVDLAANAGRLLAAPGATLEGFDVKLHGATGVGNATDRVSANGQRVQVSSSGGAIYLSAATPSVLSSVDSAGGAINISHSADLLLASAASSGGAISVSSSSANTDLIVGNLNAGSGAITLNASGSGSRVQDDGNASTRLAGGSLSLSGTAGLGSATAPLQTTASTLNLSSGNGIYLDDKRTAGVTLASVLASGGAVRITGAGPMLATGVQAAADAAGNDVSLSTSAGDLTLGSVSAGLLNGHVALSAAGSILAGGAGPQISAHAASLAVGDDIGSVTDLASGAGTPISLAVGLIDGLASSGSNRVVSVSLPGGTPLTLGSGALQLGAGSNAFVRSAGDLEAGGGFNLGSANLWLEAGGTLYLPATALATTGKLSLLGASDVVSRGAAPRELQISANRLLLRSGAAGGSTTLRSTVASLDATLSGAGDLTLANTGNLLSTTLATQQGSISASTSGSMVVDSVQAGGTGRSITLAAAGGDINLGTVHAGSSGSIDLTATSGGIYGPAASLVAEALALHSRDGVGSNTQALSTQVAQLAAQVSGSGGIHLANTGAVTLGLMSTADGDIVVAGNSHISSNTGLLAGNGGSVALASAAGDITIGHAIGQPGGGAVPGTVSLQGQHLQIGDVSSSGAQHYTGSTTLAGNLVGSGITLNGDLLLAGTRHTLDSQAANGDITLNGAVDGAVDGAAALSLNAGSGHLSLAGALGQGSRLGALLLNSSGATTLGAAINAASITTDAAGTLALNAGTVNTTGAQSYGEHAVLGADTTLTGSRISLGAGADAATAGAQRLMINGDATLGALGAQQALASLAVSGASTLAGGSVISTGSQQFAGPVTLAADSLLQTAGGDIGFASTLDGAWALNLQSGSGANTLAGAVGQTSRLGAINIASSGATSLGAAISAASLSTDAAGTLALNAGTVSTTGTQSYGERVVLGADTTLTGSHISLLAGADATSAGGQSLAINGPAHLAGALGAQQALASLTVSGETTLAAASVQTAGAQHYAGAVTAEGDAAFSGANLQFGQALTAGSGALSFNLSDAAGMLRFAPAALVSADTGFSQTGGAGVVLPSTLLVSHGPLSLAAVATLPDGIASIQAGGAVTLLGLQAPATALTLGSPLAALASPLAALASPLAGLGALSIGLNDAIASHQLDVLSLAVPGAASAQLFGLIGGQGGPVAASRIQSPLVGAPYFMNQTPWGPLEVINRLVATTVPVSVVPSAPGMGPLFTGWAGPSGFSPDALGIYAAPQVLTISPMSASLPLTVSGSSEAREPGQTLADKQR